MSRKLVDQVVIDGNISENAWEVTNSLNEKIDIIDNSARFGTMWDDRYIYAAVDVTDSMVVNSGASDPYNDDSVEIYLDGDRVKGNYGQHTAQFVFRYDDSNTYIYGNSNISMEGILQKSVKTDKGYAMEIAIPWAAFGITAAKDTMVGFTVHVNDKDENVAQQMSTGSLAYTINGGNDWGTSACWADLQLSEEAANRTLTIKKAPGEVKMDGALSEYAWELNESIAKQIGISNNTAKFATLWDDTNFYFAVDVKDAAVINSGSDGAYDDDSIELYIDCDRLRGSYGSHTAQYVFRYNDDVVHLYKDGSGVATTDGVQFGFKLADGGYTMEAAIPWKALGITAGEGKCMSFTTHVNDKDVNNKGDFAESTLAFSNDGGNDWADSANWADIILSGEKGRVFPESTQTGSNTAVSGNTVNTTETTGTSTKITDSAIEVTGQKLQNGVVHSEITADMINSAFKNGEDLGESGKLVKITINEENGYSEEGLKVTFSHDS